MTRDERVAGVPTDLAIIVRDVGALVLMQAALMTVTTGVAIVFDEWYAALSFLAAAAVTAGVGWIARRRFEGAPAPKMKHGMVIAASGWFVTAIFGALPFFLAANLTPPEVMDTYVSTGASYRPIPVDGTTTLSSLAYFQHPLHALFESMSGWTGSGLTMAIHEPSLPRAF